MRHGDDHAVRLQSPLQHVGGGLVVLHHHDPGRRGVRAHGFLRGLHEFGLMASPSSQRIATMNFEGRSPVVFSLRYACSPTAQCGSSRYHFISMMTSGSIARSDPSGDGSSPSSRACHGSAKYMRLWSAVIRTEESSALYASRLYCVTTTGRAPSFRRRAARSASP